MPASLVTVDPRTAIRAASPRSVSAATLPSSSTMPVNIYSAPPARSSRLRPRRATTHPAPVFPAPARRAMVMSNSCSPFAGGARSRRGAATWGHGKRSHGMPRSHFMAGLSGCATAPLIRALSPIRTLTVGPGVSPGPPDTGCVRVAGLPRFRADHRRFGVAPIPPARGGFLSISLPRPRSLSSRTRHTSQTPVRGVHDQSAGGQAGRESPPRTSGEDRDHRAHPVERST